MRPRSSSSRVRPIFDQRKESGISSLNSSSGFESLQQSYRYPSIYSNNSVSSFKTQNLTQSQKLIMKQIQEYPSNIYANQGQKINHNREQFNKTYQSKAINNFVNKINNAKLNKTGSFSSKYNNNNLQYINNNNILNQQKSSISINFEEQKISNEQKKYVLQFVQSLIKSYKMNQGFRDQLYEQLTNKNTDKLLTHFKKTYKQKVKLQVNNFYEMMEKTKKEEKLKKQKSIEIQIAEILICYGIQQQQFQQEIQQIKQQNFSSVIDLAPPNQRDELQCRLKRVINKYNQYAQLPQLPQETKIQRIKSNISKELIQLKQKEKIIFQIKKWRTQYEEYLNKQLQKLNAQYRSDAMIDKDNIKWKAQKLGNNILQRFKMQFEMQSNEKSYINIIRDNKKQIINHNTKYITNFIDNLKRKKVKISAPQINQNILLQKKNYKIKKQSQNPKLFLFDQDSNEDNSMKLIFKNNNQFIKEIKVNGVSQLRQKIFQKYELNQNQYTYFFNNVRINNLDEVFSSGKQQGILNIIKKIIISYEFKKLNFTIWVQSSYNKAEMKAQIVKDLIIKKEHVLDQANIYLTFQAENHQSYEFQTLSKFKQQHGSLKKVLIQIGIDITIYYQQQYRKYKMTSSQTIKDLKNKIQINYIPKEAQIFEIDAEKNLMKININSQDTLLSDLCQEGKYSFQLVLINGHTRQFYGFNKNYFQRFEQFNQFTVQTYKSLIQAIKNCNFSDIKQEQTYFNNFVAYLYSCVKKRFTLQSVIEKVQKQVAEKRLENIWVPLEDQTHSRMNESFVLMYLLSNSDQKFRIQMMNLVKNQMSIPLYLSKFDSIFDLNPELIFNRQITWILKKGITVCSIGLHSQNEKFQKGKSSLLNNIFFTNFCLTDNKHKIIQKIPYISIRVYDDLFPLNIIDIPRNCDELVISKIIQASDIVIIQSWQDQQSSANYSKVIQKQMKRNNITILRDFKQSINDSLKSINQADLNKNCILKIPNLSNKSVSQNVISIVRNKINEFLRQKKTTFISSKKILTISSQNELNILDSLVDNFQRKNIDICQFSGYARCLESQKLGDKDKVKIVQLKKTKLNQNIQKILMFLTKCNLPRQTVLIYLRQRLRSIQNQTISKYMKIYKINKLIKNSSSSCTEQQIKQLETALNQLPLIYNKDNYLLKRSGQQIKIKLDEIMSDFENKIKPKIFSVQLFWREIYAFMKFHPNYKINGYDLSSLVTQLKSKQIMNNQPFQLIDGDCLQMPKDIFKQTFSSINDNCLVISIIGPQSSGKSTLLNFLFGCDFATSQGRCTRGVYGTYFRLKDPRIPNFQGIFVIDTQGLFAVTNQVDQNLVDRENFDSKLVLFCLAVSDFVILNARGNLDKNTEKIISTCNEKFEVLNLREGQKPQIVIVLNQNNTCKTQQSQNQFKKIKDKINFSISKSFSQAYKIKNFEKNQICLLAQNQIITKKVPLSQFQKQTEIMFSQMIQKVEQKNCQKTTTKINKFFQIWQTVVSYPYLSKMNSKQYIELQLKIKQWKKAKQQQFDQQINQLIQRYNNQEIQENQVIIRLQQFHIMFLQQFKSKFQNSTNKEQLKNLIQYEKKCIKHKNVQNVSNLNCAIDQCKMKKKIKQQTWEGDQNLRIKEKQIIINQQKAIKIYNDWQKQKIFNDCWGFALQKIKKTININEKISLKLKFILNNYEYFIALSKSRLSGFGLIKNKQKLLDILQIVQKNAEQIRELLLNKIVIKIKSPQNFMIYTGKPHTNAVKGGKTDAKQKYFNMNNYFKAEQKKNYYTLSKKAILNNFVIDKFVNKVINIQKQHFQSIGHSKYVKQVFLKINETLSDYGIQILGYKQFEEVYYENTLGFFNRVIRLFSNRKHLNIKKNENFNMKRISNKPQFINISVNDIASVDSYKIYNHSRKYRYQVIERWELRPTSVIEQILYQKIKWKQIQLYCKNMQSKNSQYQKNKTKKQINKLLCQIINKDIENINLQIQQNVNIIQIFDDVTFKRHRDNAPDYQQFLQKIFQSLKTVNKQLIYTNQNTFFQKINKLEYFFGWKLQQQLRINQNHPLSLQLGSIVYETILQTDMRFKGYIQNNRNIKDKFQQSKFLKFILEQIKDKNKTLQKFLKQILQIVNNAFKKWQKFQKKSIQQVFGQINQEISLFNNDLNQISHQLHDVIIGQIHLTAIYMMWKLQIDNLIKRQNQPYQKKQKNRQIQLEKFMRRTSNNLNQINQEQISAFFDQIFHQFENIIKNKKEQIAKKLVKKFKAQVKRQQVLKNIDAEIFAKGTETQIILQYLQNPSQFIQNKYKYFYQQYFNKMNSELSKQKHNQKLFNQFKQLFEQMQHAINQVDKISEEKGYPRDLLSMDNKKVAEEPDYDDEGKKILFKYFLDKTLGKNQESPKKCKDINLALTSKLAMTSAAKGFLNQILKNIDQKQNNQLKISNLPKFVNTLLQQTVIANFRSFLKQICQIQSYEKMQFINKIRVTICKQKCPCCGRICGIQQGHLFHKCVFGHQMRALAGNYIQATKYAACQQKCSLCDNLCGLQTYHQFHSCKCGPQLKTPNTNNLNQISVKQAFVARCQQLKETDLMQYNGDTWTWTEFKMYWAGKQIGGWHYDDCNNNLNQKKKQTENKRRFINAWIRAGPDFCKKNNIEYADYNDASKQMKKIVGNIHFVFLLDQSGSMSGKPWRNLMNALNQTLTKIINYADKRSNVKITIINFEKTAKIIFQRVNPNQINVQQIPFASGSATKFEKAFSEVYQITSKYIHKQVMVVIFMTDGQDEYPQTGVKNLKGLMQNYPKKFIYSGIYTGTSKQQNNVLKLICNQLQGRNILATNLQELVQAYDSCIQIIAKKPM